MARRVTPSGFFCFQSASGRFSKNSVRSAGMMTTRVPNLRLRNLLSLSASLIDVSPSEESCTASRIERPSFSFGDNGIGFSLGGFFGVCFGSFIAAKSHCTNSLSGLSEPQHRRVSRDPDLISTDDDRHRPAVGPLSALLFETSTRARFATRRD
jgi:hypothetical protein